MEVIVDGGGMLSVVLVGHPKLRNDLRRPTMEEIGYRSVIFEFDGMAGNQAAYIRWLLGRCAVEGLSLDESGRSCGSPPGGGGGTGRARSGSASFSNSSDAAASRSLCSSTKAGEQVGR